MSDFDFSEKSIGCMAMDAMSTYRVVRLPAARAFVVGSAPSEPRRLARGRAYHARDRPASGRYTKPGAWGTQPPRRRASRTCN